MNSLMKTNKKTEWVEQADAAMKRAAESARKLAARTATPMHVFREGKIVKLEPSKVVKP